MGRRTHVAGGRPPSEPVTRPCRRARAPRLMVALAGLRIVAEPVLRSVVLRVTPTPSS